MNPKWPSTFSASDDDSTHQVSPSYDYPLRFDLGWPLTDLQHFQHRTTTPPTKFHFHTTIYKDLTLDDPFPPWRRRCIKTWSFLPKPDLLTKFDGHAMYTDRHIVYRYICNFKEIALTAVNWTISNSIHMNQQLGILLLLQSNRLKWLKNLMNYVFLQ